MKLPRSTLLWPMIHPILFLRNGRKWIGNPISDDEVVFIVGVPRSGTTLLKTLLVAHSDIAGTAYESTGLFRLRDFESYQVGEISDNVVNEAVCSCTSVIGLYETITGELLNFHDAIRFVDKLTIRKWRLDFVVKHFPNAKFLHIVRDGRDCLCSARKHPNVHQSSSVEKFARYWNYCVNTVRQTIPAEKLFQLGYEDLTQFPTKKLKEIMGFLDLTYQETQLDPDVYCPKISRHSSVHKNLNGPITQGSLRRWERDLLVSDQKAFTAIAGEELSRYGYDVRS